jgi:hypothetical protein
MFPLTPLASVVNPSVSSIALRYLAASSAQSGESENVLAIVEAGE